MKLRTVCPACGSSNRSHVFSAPFTSPMISKYLTHHYEGRSRLDQLEGQVFTVMECQECSLLFQLYVPDDDLLNELYDEWIPEPGPARVTLADSRYRIDQVDYLIQATGKDPADISFLDFGCGWSEWLLVARAFGCDVTGAELSQVRQEHAARLGIRMLEGLSSKFDVINLEQVLEHLVDPRGILVQLRDSLKDGGIIRVSVPDGRGMARKLSGTQTLQPGDLMPVHPLEHVNCFTHASLDAIAQAAGLKIIRPSLLQLYDSTSGWVTGLKRNLIRPLYRHIYPRSTTVFLGRA